MKGYLNSNNKEECFGCESCAQVCPKRAITMQEDIEGFRYPVVNLELCIHCGMCSKVCPYENEPQRFKDEKLAFGGYTKDPVIREESTSGGAFSAIVESWCDENYVIFGATANGLEVYHDYIVDKSELYKVRKSKYSQSIIGDTYKQVKQFLIDGKKVLFSGTPCQNAALKTYLNKVNQDNLLMVEVICEGVPSPHFVRKYDVYIKEKYGASIKLLDYRYKDMYKTKNSVIGRWDFQVMYTLLEDGRKMKKDRWFNPFWSIWLNHLMSRPSCYRCPFATTERVADISLGDLWGVHLFCPELYGKNAGASLVVCNTEKGKKALELAKETLYGHDLEFETALKYQSPMRNSISQNSSRDAFMKDLQRLDYKRLCKKWAKKASVKLILSKYVWGNRQKIFLWELKQKFQKNHS